MAGKMTAREYADAMEEKFGPDGKVTWLSIGELTDLYYQLDKIQNLLDQATTFDCPAVLVMEDRIQDEREWQDEQDRDQRDTIQSVLSSMLPF